MTLVRPDMDAHSSATSIGHMASERWAFDAEVTRVFSDMLTRSIPMYTTMRDAVFGMGSTFVRDGTHVVDLGCSRGDALAPFVAQFGAANRYVGIEVSNPMLEVARARFRSEIESGIVSILSTDLRHGYPSVQASVTLSVLTLQFVPLEYRQRIVADVWRTTVPGGAFILVEKVLGSGAALSNVMIDLYHQYKQQNGYNTEEIERKRLSLEGVLVPVTARWNEELLRAAGFREIDCFWRWMNFAAWICVKQ